jgi:hypothetical protein
MKYRGLVLILFSAFLFPLAAHRGEAKIQMPLLPGKTVSIHQIKAEKGKLGAYRTEGYVVNSYTCPPCPPRAQCKPCMMATNIVISEENKSLESYQLTDEDMIVFTKDAAAFEKGKKYIFSIKVTDRKTTAEPMNDVELVEYSPAK